MTQIAQCQRKAQVGGRYHGFQRCVFRAIWVSSGICAPLRTGRYGRRNDHNSQRRCWVCSQCSALRPNNWAGGFAHPLASLSPCALGDIRVDLIRQGEFELGNHIRNGGVLVHVQGHDHPDDLLLGEFATSDTGSPRHQSRVGDSVWIDCMCLVPINIPRSWPCSSLSNLGLTTISMPWVPMCKHFASGGSSYCRLHRDE